MAQLVGLWQGKAAAAELLLPSALPWVSRDAHVLCSPPSSHELSRYPPAGSFPCSVGVTELGNFPRSKLVTKVNLEAAWW